MNVQIFLFPINSLVYKNIQQIHEGRGGVDQMLVFIQATAEKPHFMWERNKTENNKWEVR